MILSSSPPSPQVLAYCKQQARKSNQPQPPNRLSLHSCSLSLYFFLSFYCVHTYIHTYNHTYIHPYTHTPQTIRHTDKPQPWFTYFTVRYTTQFITNLKVCSAKLRHCAIEGALGILHQGSTGRRNCGWRCASQIEEEREKDRVKKGERIEEE